MHKRAYVADINNHKLFRKRRWHQSICLAGKPSAKLFRNYFSLLAENEVDRMSEELMKVGDLKTYSRRVNVKVKVLSKTEPREVTSRRSGSTFRIAEALVGDETGCVLLDLWDDDIEKFEEGDIIGIKNGYVKLFQDSMRLNIGRYGQAEKLEEDMSDVNTENNLSERRFSFQSRRDRY